MRYICLTLVLLLLSCGLASADINVNTTGWWRTGDAFNASGTPIQAAHDGAISGEVLSVQAGTYTSGVTVTTAYLTFTGAGSDVCKMTGSAFKTQADYTNISEFNISGSSGYGLHLDVADHCNIYDIIVVGNVDGIYLYESKFCIFENIDVISNTNTGMAITYLCNNNSYTNINASGNANDGLATMYCNNNTYTNIITNNNNYGMTFSIESNTIVTNITANSNGGTGVLCSDVTNISFNDITTNLNWLYGINLQTIDDSTTCFTNVEVINNVRYGIYLDSQVHNVTFTNVDIVGRRYGIYIRDYTGACNNNVFTNVDIKTGKYAIHQDASSTNNDFSNVILEHTLFSNVISATDIRDNASYAENEAVNLTFSVKYINNTPCTDFSYVVAIYPDTSNTFSTNEENLSVNFTPTKNGIYSVKLNITTSEGSELRKYTLLIGNTTSKNARRWYLHSDLPVHGQPNNIYANIGSMWGSNTSVQETRSTGGSTWLVEFYMEEILNYYPLITNITTGWYYTVSGSSDSRIQHYGTYGTGYDHTIALPNSSVYVFNTSEFTSIKFVTDYIYGHHWLGCKLYGTAPTVVSNSTQQSYIDMSYSYVGVEIKEFQPSSASDMKNIRLLSSYFNDEDERQATLELEGEGDINLSIQMPRDAEYSVKYDNVDCASNPNCAINSNLSGEINLTIGLDSNHELCITQVPSCVMTLLSGWNIIGWISFPDRTARYVGTSIGGNCTYITERNKTTGNYVTHFMSGPEDENNFAVELGWGYYVRTSDETLWTRY